MTLSIPQFLAIEINDDLQPLAIAWSKTNYEIVECLILPFEDNRVSNERWLDSAYEYAFAQNTHEIIRLLESNLVSDTLYVNDLQDNWEALEKIFSESEQNNFLTLIPAWHLYPKITRSQWLLLREEIIFEQQLNSFHAADEIKAMLYLNQQLVR